MQYRLQAAYLPMCALVAALLAGVTLYRAATISFTHDESLSYILFMDEALTDVLTLNTPTLFPNNHILNTVGMRIADTVLGASELSLRLTSAAALLPFLLFAALISGRYARGAWRPVSFLLLALNPYLLEQFCLARGYGMASAFLLGAVWFFLRAQEDIESRRWPPLAILFAGLASLAHLTFLVPAVLVAAMTFLGLLRGRPEVRQSSGRLLGPVGAAVAAAAALFAPIRRMLELPSLEGPAAGFWQDTVVSLASDWQNDPVWGQLGSSIVLAVVAALVIAGALYVVVVARRGLDALADPAAVVTALLLACVVANVAQFHLLDMPYLSHRFATFYLPLFALSCGLLLDRLCAGWSTPLTAFVTVSLSLFLVFHTLTTLNFAYLREGRRESGVRQMLALMAGDWERCGMTRSAVLWFSPIYGPSIEFYRRTLDLDWITVPDPVGGPYDYYVVAVDDDARLPAGGRILFNDTSTGTRLAAAARAATTLTR